MKIKIIKELLWFTVGAELDSGKLQSENNISEEDIKKWISDGLAIESAEVKTEETPIENKQELDFNGDGKVDKEDRSLAGKLLGKKGKRGKRK